MVTDIKAKVSYMEFLKEDLFIIRIVPEGGVPDYKAGQFLKIIRLFVEHIQLLHILKTKNILNL